MGNNNPGHSSNAHRTVSRRPSRASKAQTARTTRASTTTFRSRRCTTCQGHSYENQTASPHLPRRLLPGPGQPPRRKMPPLPALRKHDCRRRLVVGGLARCRYGAHP
ncbi:MAG: hypothetical protein [Podoviridae sp. ctdb7]|nr:MAG: hypothetical protein [Podoviridae sp. ctdb7]